MPPSRLRTAAQLERLLSLTHIRGATIYIELDDHSHVEVQVNRAMMSLCFGPAERDRHLEDLGIPGTHEQAVSQSMFTQYWGCLAVKPDAALSVQFTVKQVERRHDDSSETAPQEAEPPAGG